MITRTGAAVRRGIRRGGRPMVSEVVSRLYREECHARAARAEDTDWPAIAAFYAELARVQPSPVVELNRAAAVAMAEGPEAGLRLLDALEGRGELTRHHLLHAARADLLRRTGRWAEAARSYRQALALASNEPERHFLRRRLAEAERHAAAADSRGQGGTRSSRSRMPGRPRPLQQAAPT